MEDLAASSLVSHSRSAPLYLLYDVSSLTKHGLPPPVHDDGFDFEFATAAAAAAKSGSGDAALRACASDVSADDLFRAGVLLPLRLPPRLQRPARSAATSPTCRTTATKNRGFDPFAAALEKVRGDAAPRRSRSLSPLRRGSVAAASAHSRKDSSNNNPRAPRPEAAPKASRAVATWPTRKGVKQLLCRAVMASAAAAPRALRPRKKGGVSSYRPGLLVCFGF